MTDPHSSRATNPEIGREDAARIAEKTLNARHISGKKRGTNSSRSGKRTHKKTQHFWESWTFLIVVCILLPLGFRSVAYAPFHIPSGSMKPTLLVGDFIFVSKFPYGYSRYSFPFGYPWFEGRTAGDTPQRGEVVVFRPPSEPGTDYIKRLIGLPGDTVQVINSELYLNGEQVPRRRIEDFVETLEDGSVSRVAQYIETLPNGTSYTIMEQTNRGQLDNTRPYIVPEGHYFMMGDNRDGSTDSRVLHRVGYVPAENLVGRAEVIFLSTEDSLWKVWTWPTAIRTERVFTNIR